MVLNRNWDDLPYFSIFYHLPAHFHSSTTVLVWLCRDKKTPPTQHGEKWWWKLEVYSNARKKVAFSTSSLSFDYETRGPVSSQRSAHLPAQLCLSQHPVLKTLPLTHPTPPLNSFCSKTEEPYAVLCPGMHSSKWTEDIWSLAFSPTQSVFQRGHHGKYSGPWQGWPLAPAWWPFTLNIPDPNSSIQSELKGLGSSSHRDGLFPDFLLDKLWYISAKSAWLIPLFSSMFLLIFEWLICPRLREKCCGSQYYCVCVTSWYFNRPFLPSILMRSLI